MLEPQPDTVRVDRIESPQQAKAIHCPQFGEMDESWLEIYSFVPGKFTVLPSVKSKLTVDRVLLVLSARILFFFFFFFAYL